MIKLEIDVYRTLGKLGIVDYDTATVVSELSTGKDIEIEVSVNTGSIYYIMVNSSDIVFVVEYYHIMLKALDQFDEDKTLENFNKFVSAGKAHFKNVGVYDE